GAAPSAPRNPPCGAGCRRARAGTAAPTPTRSRGLPARSRADLDLAFLAPLAQTHDPVDGVQIGPGRGLDHVGRHAASGHLEAVRLHLDHDVAERVAATGDRVHLEVGEPAFDA